MKVVEVVWIKSRSYKIYAEKRLLKIWEDFSPQNDTKSVNIFRRFCNSGFVNEPCSTRNTIYITEEFTKINKKTQCLDITGINKALRANRNFLETYDIQSLRNIQTIFAENSQISFIPKVEKFVRLEEFHLSDNNISFLPPKAFRRNHKLRLLVLNKNKIRSRKNRPILESVSVEILILSINRIAQINKSTFAQMPKLRVLYLDNNKISKIPFNTFQYVPNLKYLRITKNPIIALNIFLPPNIDFKSDIENVIDIIR